MPSRIWTLTIVILWLSVSTWMFFREFWPWLQAGEPPPYTFELIDEIGTSHAANVIGWDILQRGQKIGYAQSSIKRGSDRIFELKTDYFFNRGHLLKVLDLQKWSYTVRVDRHGELRQFDSHIGFNFTGDLAKVIPKRLDIKVSGSVTEGQLRVRPQLPEDLPLKLPEPKPVPAPKRLLNPMHLLNRFPGLRAGQSWKEPLFNPFSLGSLLPADLGNILPEEVVADKSLLAEVHNAVLDWDGLQIPCFKIEYREPGQKTVATTWVRRRDGLILQQEASQMGLELVIRRETPK
jgi:hypothetical protein